MDTNQTLADVFCSIAQTYPKNRALESDELTVNYETLKSMITILGTTLESMSPPENPFIVSFLGGSALHVITSLAALYVSKIVVVIHESYTPIQLEKCFSSLHYPLVVTNKRLWSTKFMDMMYERIFVLDNPDGSPLHLFPLRQSMNGHQFKAENIAYCYFTSGSTGNPKPVLITHRCVINAANYLRTKDSSVIRGLMGMAVSFIPSLSDIWQSIVSGGTLVVPPPEVKLDIDVYRRWITENEITTATFATPIFEMIMSKDVESLTTLRIAYAGGARLNPNRINLSKAKFTVYNIYGGTEFFIGSRKCIPPGTEEVSASVGFPIDNMKIYIVNENEELITDAEVRGEIWVTGYGLMEEYYNQPELTAKVMTPNPFNPEMGKVYHTGDIGYWSGDGELFVVGRKDHQVKIHGMRLELGEIETALTSHPGIEEAVACLQPGSNSNVIIAFCATGNDTDSEQLNTAEVQGFLSTKLQQHAIPSEIHFMKRLPLTPSGKFDRVGLSQQFVFPEITVTSEPETDTSAFVRSIWEEVLGHSVKPTDNFFFSGGNSLLTVKMNHLLENRFSDLQPTLIFDFPIFADFVRALTNSENNTKQTINWESEIQLPADFPKILSKSNHTNMLGSNILVTGGTGFLGRLLLRDLRLKRPQALIVAIVRGKNDDEATERLLDVLKDVLEPEYAGGILVFAGDISKENFGLEWHQYDFLVKSIGTIFHCAAEVTFMKTYDLLRSTVDMTRNILKFAAEGKFAKTVHHLSTIGVFDGIVGEHDDGSSEYIADESELPNVGIDPGLMKTGYFQCKWVCEKLVSAAASRGLPVYIYRIGQVGSCSESKIVNRRDAIAGFLIVCNRLGSFPNNPKLRLPFVDADEAVRAIEELSKNEDLALHGGVFHIIGNETSLEDFLGWMADIRQVDLCTWEKEFKELSRSNLETEDNFNAWVFLEQLKNELASIGKRSSVSFSITFATSRISKILQKQLASNPKLYMENLKLITSS